MSLTTTVSELNSHDEKKLVECHMNHRGRSQPTLSRFNNDAVRSLNEAANARQYSISRGCVHQIRTNGILTDMCNFNLHNSYFRYGSSIDPRPLPARWWFGVSALGIWFNHALQSLTGSCVWVIIARVRSQRVGSGVYDQGHQ